MLSSIIMSAILVTGLGEEGERSLVAIGAGIDIKGFD
jgi:hypothetical protein